MKQYVPTWSTLCLVIICFACFIETEFQAVSQDDLSLLCRPGRPGAWDHSLFLPLPPEDENYSGGVSAFTCWAFSSPRCAFSYCDQEQLGKFISAFRFQSVTHRRKPRQELQFLEEETEAKTREEHCFIGLLLWVCLQTFAYIPGPPP